MTRRRQIRFFVLGVTMLAAASPCLAQPPKEPIPLFVLDARGTSAGLPSETGWTPLVPPDTQLPSRAFGLDVGAHIYPLRFKSVAFGFGATWDFARGRTVPADLPSGSAAPVVLIPEVTTRVTSLAPQLSLNFGHSLGWSYLSAGLGQTRVKSEAETQSTIQYLPVDSGWVKAINYGGGARWFAKPHLAFTFDVRFHQVDPGTPLPGLAGSPRTTMMIIGAGVSLK